jgi:hypothetical protein
MPSVAPIDAVVALRNACRLALSPLRSLPGSRHRGDIIRIGEDANLVVLKKEEWNVLVDAIRSGQLGRA